MNSDAVLGCVLGGAIGDACCGQRERYGLGLSDDTQLTLATCEAIARIKRADPAAIAQSFLDWFRTRRLSGLGASTLKALRDLDAGAHWALCGARGERAAGNGAAMRIAPLAFVLDPDSPSDRTTIRDVCRITHHHDDAYVGALAVLYALRHPDWIDDPSHREIVAHLPDSGVRDRLVEIGTCVPTETIADLAVRFGDSGHVVDTVPLALAAAHRGRTAFAAVIDAIAALPGDADTIGSISGQILGRRIGAAALPLTMVPAGLLLTTRDIANRFAATIVAQ